jgi:tRNA-2-methylthio-N6-dimethylallyladenosine synthase
MEYYNSAMKFHIITFGCQMNEHDSERMSGILEEQGGIPSTDPEKADMVILNTCSIREKAEQKFYSELGRLRSLKSEHPGLKIAVAGCIAQQEGRNILSRAPYVDIVFGPSDIARLSAIVDKGLIKSSPVIETGGDPEYHRKTIKTARRDKIKAWVSIMYGCDNFCTYCIVPYLRGRERSRQPQDIVREVQQLAVQGYQEVTLLGQNVNSYGKGLEQEIDFPALLRMINDETSISRIRFVTSHPRDLSRGLISAVRDLSKVCEAIHLPVQSGSDSILRAMNRKYSRQEYKDKVDRLRETVPDIALTTDIIVGFPGETEQDYEMTSQLLQEVQFDGIFAFKYSKRPGTAALALADHVKEEVKERRLTEILALQKAITVKKNKVQIGSIREILIDGTSKKGGTLTGRTRGNKTVNVAAPGSLMGSLVKVRITDASVNSLTGALCE